jgi:hypothetical protein
VQEDVALDVVVLHEGIIECVFNYVITEVFGYVFVPAIVLYYMELWSHSLNLI